MITINKKINLIGDKDCSLFLTTAHYKGYISGRLLGYVDMATTLDSSQALERLIDCIRTDEEVTDFMRWSVGSFFIVIVQAQSVTIYTSPKGPGFFYYKKNGKLHIATDELAMARECVDSGLNEMELLHLLSANTSSSSCLPFSTLFAKAKRIPGGTRAVINADLQIQSRMYISDSSFSQNWSDEENYEIFKRIFEHTCRLICQDLEHDKIYATLSAGIDSSVILLACLKNGLDIIPLHWRKNDTITTAVNILCKRLGKKAKFIGLNYGLIDPIKLDWEKARHFYSNSLGIMGIGHWYVTFADNPAAYLTGIGFGCIIQTNGLMRTNFGESIVTRYLQDALLKMPLRYMFTKGFYNWIRKGVGRKYLKTVGALTGKSDWIVPTDIYDYLLSLTLTNKLPCRPTRVLPEGIDEFTQEYLRYIEREVLEPIIGSDAYREIKANRDNALRFDEIRRLSRLIRYAIQVQKASKNDSCCENAGHYTLASPPIEGPIVSFFMNCPLTFRDVYRPKRYLFRYFREEAGYSYDAFLNEVWRLRDRRPIKDYIKELGRRIGLVRSSRTNHWELLINSQAFRKNYLPVLRPEDSALIPLIKDDHIRAYVRELFIKCNQDHLKNFAEVNQLLNLELFIRNVQKR